MKSMKKRILSFLLVAVMLISCIPVFATETETDSLVGTTYKYDLTIDKPTNANFRMAAIRKIDGVLVEIDETSKATWGTWPGFWPVSETVNGNYVFGKSEGADGYLDMMPGDKDYMPALVFKAPADGVYDIYFEGLKYQYGDVSRESFVDVFLFKNGNPNPLNKKTVNRYDENAGNLVFESFGVALKAGEEIIVASDISLKNTAGTCHNFRIVAFEADYVAAEGGTVPGNHANGTVFECGLTATTKTSYAFRYAGILEDGTIDYLEDTSRTVSWAGGNATYQSWHLKSNASVSVTCYSQAGGFVDLTPRSGVDAAVIFTAPVSGVYSFTSNFIKGRITNTDKNGDTYYPVYKVEAIAGETVIDKHTFQSVSPASGKESATLEGDSIVLEAGETIMFVASLIDGVRKDPEIAPTNISVTLEKTYYDEKHYGYVDRFNTVHDSVFIGAWKISDSTVWPVDTKVQASPTWQSAPEAYWGNWVKDHKVAVTQGTEDGKDLAPLSRAKFDLQSPSRNDFLGLIGFTAPADGVFDFTATFKKIYNGYIGLDAYKFDGESCELLQSFDLTAGQEVVKFFVENVELKKGEQILIITNDDDYVSELPDGTKMAKNMGYVSFTVDALYSDCPHYFDGDSTCYVCGADCAHDSWTDGICNACDTACGHESWANGRCAVCDTVCAHDWSGNDGVCKICALGCPSHNEKTATGACATCGKGHTHAGGAATCQKGAICDTCGYEYGTKDVNAHTSNEFTYVNLGNGTHEKRYACCGALAATEDCDCNADNGFTCENCGYLDETAKTEHTLGYNAEGALANYLYGEEYDVNPVGPTAGALDGYLLTKPEDDLGVIYAHFNLRFDDKDGKLVLRNHFYTTVTDYKVYVNDVETAFSIEEGYNTYYVETVYALDELDDAAKITIEVGGKTVTYEVSVYNYMAVALKNTNDAKLIDVINALYDYNEYAKAN